MQGTRKTSRLGLKPGGFLLGTVLLSGYASAHATSLGSNDYFPQEPPENLLQEVSEINPELGRITDSAALAPIELKPPHRYTRKTTLLDGAVRFLRQSRCSLSQKVRGNYPVKEDRRRQG